MALLKVSYSICPLLKRRKCTAKNGTDKLPPSLILMIAIAIFLLNNEIVGIEKNHHGCFFFNGNRYSFVLVNKKRIDMGFLIVMAVMVALIFAKVFLFN